MFVCTANICRSPTAEALLRAKLRASAITCAVVSGGLLEGSNRCPDDLVEVAVKWGLDLRAHRSHQVTRAQVEGADLVLTMERAHVRDVALMSESSWPRTFTLPEAIRRAEELGPRAPDESLPVWVGRLHGGRQSADLLLERKSDEVDDPYMCGQERYEAMCSELDQLTDELLELVWPQASAVDSENADLPGEEREDEDQAGWRRKLRLATGKRRAGA